MAGSQQVKKRQGTLPGHAVWAEGGSWRSVVEAEEKIGWEAGGGRR